MVVRNDRLARYQEDLGDAKDFTRDEFRIPGGVVIGKKIYIEHTVEELRAIADERRAQKGFDKRELVGLDKIK